jgi:glycosyltransferase involved in cell wall biosynthesis
MITVLLAAWNGEAYLEEQLDSILGQDGLELNDLRIVISDDGSTDRTREILEAYHAQFPEQILLKHRSAERKAKDLADGIPAAAGNFFWLLSQAGESDYYMLSDQDDVWKPNKIEALMMEMMCQEVLNGADHPILVHSDMEVVDANLKTIHPSFFKYQKCNPDRTGFSEILVENSVTGGAVMMNRALVELLKERPQACFMHDWWIALAASCFGTISCVKEALYLYRQHGHNTLGAKETGSVKDMAERLERSAQVEENYRKMAAQAHAFGNMYGDRMNPEQKAVLRAYLALRYQSPMGRFRNIVKNRFYKSSKLQTLAQCMTIPRPDGDNWPI